MAGFDKGIDTHRFLRQGPLDKLNYIDDADDGAVKTKMSDRSFDWLEQAKRDLEQALDSQKAERHEWACFAAQQSAEKAVKALHLFCKQDAWGHVVRKLLQELPERIAVTSELLDKARVLDSFYMPTRYANGHPEGSPFEHYGKLQSDEAIKHAREILEFCRAQMA